MVVSQALSMPLACAPAKESTLKKTFEENWEFKLDSLSVLLDGRELSDSFLRGCVFDVGLTQEIVVLDTYHETRNGRPIQLTREFQTVSQEQTLEFGYQGFGNSWNDWKNIWSSSDLEGSAVEFQWEDGEYQKSFYPGLKIGDDRHLDGLREDMDLRALLPNEQVIVGDSWEIDLTSLPDLLSPGGYMSWKVSNGSESWDLLDILQPRQMRELRKVLGSMLAGDAIVTYVSAEDEHSELQIAIDVWTQEDADRLTELAQEMAAIWDPIELIDLRLDVRLEAKGVAFWNSAENQIESMELSGQLENEFNLDLEWNNGYFSIQLSTISSAIFELSVEVE